MYLYACLIYLLAIIIYYMVMHVVCLGVHQPVVLSVPALLAGAEADLWLKVCVQDFCLSGDYNGNLSCIDRAA